MRESRSSGRAQRCTVRATRRIVTRWPSAGAAEGCARLGSSNALHIWRMRLPMQLARDEGEGEPARTECTEREREREREGGGDACTVPRSEGWNESDAGWGLRLRSEGERRGSTAAAEVRWGCWPRGHGAVATQTRGCSQCLYQRLTKSAIIRVLTQVWSAKLCVWRDFSRWIAWSKSRRDEWTTVLCGKKCAGCLAGREVVGDAGEGAAPPRTSVAGAAMARGA